MTNYKQLCLATCHIARESGRFMAEERKNFDASMVEHKGLHDLVSYVDRASEVRIIAALQALLPESGFIAEEGTSTKQGERFNWVIDPLDGTTNFLHGFPQYSISIALMSRGQLEQAVVYDPNRNDLFTATRGRGAFLNDKRIRVSNRAKLQSAMIGTGFPFRDFKHLDTYLGMFKDMVKNTAGLRRPGSAALDLAYVAAGWFDGFWEIGLSKWDIAAGALLVQ